MAAGWGGEPTRHKTHAIGCTHLVMVWTRGWEERGIRSDSWVWAGAVGEVDMLRSGEDSRGCGICRVGFGSRARRDLRGGGPLGGWGVTEAGTQRISRRRQQSITMVRPYLSACLFSAFTPLPSPRPTLLLKQPKLWAKGPSWLSPSVRRVP